ncbi:MAG: hypothetical protein QM765_37570 [Myxococcales bacterium]
MRPLSMAAFTVVVLAAAQCRAETVCETYAKQSPLPEKASQRVSKAYEIRQALRQRAASFSSVEVGFAVVGKTPSGVIEPRICPATELSPPIIYVPAPFLDCVYARDGEGPKPGLFATDSDSDAFVAFVVGHELGHRIEHLDKSGQGVAKGLSSDGNVIEIQADARGLFFATAAGYRMKELARRDPLKEIFGDHPEFKVRHEDLVGLFEEFGEYARRFEAAMALSYLGRHRAAQYALAALDERLAQSDKLPKITASEAGKGLSLPEIRLARATADLLEARPRQAECQLLLPGRLPLGEPEVRGPKMRTWGEALLEARTFVDEAEAAAGPTPVSQVLRSCIAYYEGNESEAKASLAWVRANAKSPAALQVAQWDEALLEPLSRRASLAPRSLERAPGARRWGRRWARGRRIPQSRAPSTPPRVPRRKSPARRARPPSAGRSSPSSAKRRAADMRSGCAQRVPTPRPGASSNQSRSAPSLCARSSSQAAIWRSSAPGPASRMGSGWFLSVRPRTASLSQ